MCSTGIRRIYVLVPDIYKNELTNYDILVVGHTTKERLKMLFILTDENLRMYGLGVVSGTPDGRNYRVAQKTSDAFRAWTPWGLVRKAKPYSKKVSLSPNHWSTHRPTFFIRAGRKSSHAKS